MSSPENPTFDPANLPSEEGLRIQAQHDFLLLEEGATPDEIATLRKMVEVAREESREYERDILWPYLSKYGVEFESELPVKVQVELANVRRIYFRGGRYIE